MTSDDRKSRWIVSESNRFYRFCRTMTS
ncbi:hypothetical protein DPB93_23715 [Salmonella enterica subsp. salamae]|nr:hypothetical protein [Salmonella enterica subsp. salamae]ECI4078579.1 hypothetical protein [Salmonella enterica subsp. salamae]EEO2383752.1 hypothetical protein [Salmonella enterica]